MPLATASLAYDRLALITTERNTHTPGSFRYLELDSVLSLWTGQFNLRYPSFVPGAPADTGLFTDTFSTIDGVLNVLKWTVTTIGSGTSIGVVSQQAIFTTGAVGSYGATARALAIHTPIVHSRLRCSVQIDDTKREQFPMIGVRCDGVWQSAEQVRNGYMLILDTNANNITIRKSVSGTPSTLATPAYVFNAKSSYEVAFEAQGSALRVKVWPVGTTEPAAFTWTGTDTSLTAAGVVMMALTGGNAAVATSIAVDGVTLTEMSVPVVIDPTPPPDPGTGLTYTGPRLTLADVGPRSAVGAAQNNQTITTAGTRSNQYFTGTTIVQASAAGAVFNDCQFDGYCEIRGDVTLNYCRMNGEMVIRECSGTLTRCGVSFSTSDGLDFFRVTDGAAIMNLFLRECVVVQDGTAYPETPPGSGLFAHGDAFQAVGADSVTAVGCTFDDLVTPTFGAGGVVTSGQGHTSAFNTQPGSNVTHESGPIRTYDCSFRGGSACIYAKTYDSAIAASTIIHTNPKLSQAAGGLYIYRSSVFPGPTIINATDWSGAALVGI